ncbi:hypothetical protein PRLR5067_30930 [Prevotella lacticifex]|nr:hypothetical protein PRLR5003_30830 [Prevotella lacticifex]GJG57057.1 hypothetical protein PRLR5067_30930 [Prevotella lacticifex]
MLLALIIAGGGMNAQADDAVYKTLDFAKASQPKVNDYTTKWTATSEDKQDNWTISNFSNYNNEWLYVRCGSKKGASIATIANSNAYSSAVTKVVVTYDAVKSNPKTTYLEVSTDPKFSTVDEKVVVATPKAGDVAYTISSPKANAYYRLVVDNPKYSSNGQIQISKLVYYISSEPGKTITSLSFGENADKTFWKGDKEGLTFTQTATLTPAVEGAKITYSSSDENVAVVDANSGEVLVSTDNAGKATITATYAGDDTHVGSTATYNITVEFLYQNLAELKAAYSNADINAAVRLTDAQVTNVDGLNHFMQDATGAVDVWNKDFNYAVGDKLNGIANVTYKLNKGLPEITAFAPIGGITKTTDALPTPTVVTITDATKDENICKYIVIKNVSITPSSKTGNATAKDKDGNTIAVFKSKQTYVAGDYDLMGNPSVYVTTGAKEMVFSSYAPDFTIDEGADANAITAGENGTVIIDRTFNANAWNTLVLPFDLTAEQLAAKFGADAKFATYTGTSKNNDGTYTLKFQSVSALTANTPVFVWGANNKELYEFSGVKVVKADPTSTPSDAAFSFTGSYDKTTLKAGDWFISSDNKFYRALGTETMKPMRAVFRPVSAAAAKGLSFSIDGGEATGISAITADGSIVVNDNAPMYNLAGQRVNDSYKGVVIQNGKKYIK